jgi:hypothetical protein
VGSNCTSLELMNFRAEGSWEKNENQASPASVASIHTGNVIDIDVFLQGWVVEEEKSHFQLSLIPYYTSHDWCLKASKMTQEYHYIQNLYNWVNGAGHSSHWWSHTYLIFLFKRALWWLVNFVIFEKLG